jgi:hypothetical protein
VSINVGSQAILLPGLPAGASRTIQNVGPITVYWGDQNVSGLSPSIPPGQLVVTDLTPVYVISPFGPSQILDTVVPGSLVPEGVVVDDSVDPLSPISAPAPPRNRALKDFISVLNYDQGWVSGDVSQNLLGPAFQDSQARAKKIYLPSSPGGPGTTYGVLQQIPLLPGMPVNIEGDGPASILDCSNIINQVVPSAFIMLEIDGVLGAQNLLTADAPEGSVALNVTTTSGYVPGQQIFVGSSDSTQSSSLQKPGEIVRILSISGSQINLYSPTHASYLMSATAYVYPITWVTGNRFKGFRFQGTAQQQVTLTTNGTTSVTGISPQMPVGSVYTINGATAIGIAEGLTLTINGLGTGVLSVSATGSGTGSAILTLPVVGCRGFRWWDWRIEEVDAFETNTDGFNLVTVCKGVVRGGAYQDILQDGAAVGIALGYASQDIEITGIQATNMWHAVAIGGGSSTPGGWPRRIDVHDNLIDAANLNCHPCGEQISFRNNQIEGNLLSYLGVTDAITMNAASSEVSGNKIRDPTHGAIVIQPATTVPNVHKVRDNTIIYSQTPTGPAIDVAPLTGAFTANTGLFYDIDHNEIRYMPGVYNPANVYTTYPAILVKGGSNALAGRGFIGGYATAIEFDSNSSGCSVTPDITMVNVTTPLQDLQAVPSGASPLPFINILDAARAGECETMARDPIQFSNLAFTGGNWLGHAAISRTAHTYTQIRFMTGATAPSGLTDVRCGVADTSVGNILQQTGNMASSVTAANTLYTFNLLSSLSLAAGQSVQLGMAVLGTTLPTVMGWTLTGKSAINSLAPKQTFASTAILTTGNPLTNPGVSGGTNAGIYMGLL